MNHLEIKHLRMIRSIAETGNMTRAAEKLYLSQSALSQQLKDIESKLQVDLFHRTRKKMVLTSSGRKLLRTAEHIVELLDDTELEIAKLVAGDRGELKIGTHCIFCFKWLPGLMVRFRKQFPNVEIEIDTSHDPAMELDQKRYDIIISARSLSDNTHAQQPLFQDQLVCIMDKDHPLAGQSYIHLKDFQDINMISHAEKGESKFYELLLQPKGIEPKRFMTVGQPQAIVELVISGLGVSVFPLWAVTGAIDAGSLIAKPISRNGVPLTWRALFLKGNNMPIYQKELIRMMQRVHSEIH
jgi:LysR family transcriptional regulator, regulator for metE and metH